MSWWCIFKDESKNGTITIPDDRLPDWNDFGEADEYNEALKKAVYATAKEVVGEEPIEIHSLPYPHTPQLNDSGCPSFCFGGKECWDRGSCPREYACDD